MLIDYRERLLREPALRDIKNWPAIPADQVAKSKRPRFRQNLRAVAMALSNTHYSEITLATGIHSAQITRLLQRALTCADDAQPPLTRALIPNQHVHKPHRRQALSTMELPAGAKGAFAHLLEIVPELKSKLDVVIKADLDDRAESENLTPNAFHAYLMLFLKEAQHDAMMYPYTEDSLAYESARRYFHSRRDQLQQERDRKNEPKRIIAPDQCLFEVAREIQIDEQIYDGESSIYLDFGNSAVPMRIGRFSVVIVVDADSSCVLGFRTAFTQHCSQYDVLSSLHVATLPTDPITLNTEGLYVFDGPNFPNECGEEFARIAFNSVALDNALAHCAHSVEQHICDVHAGTFSLGLAAAPKVRRVVEGAIGILSRQAKRLKSTSGSHSQDPVKESRKLKKRAPSVTVAELEEAIYVVLAHHNRQAKAYLSGMSPLDTYKFMIANRPLRLLPEDTLRRRAPFTLEKKVPVKWIKAEHRSPHINAFCLRYTGSCLAGLQGEEVTLVYDYRDIRELEVVDQSGRLRGTVRAPKSWQRYPHSVKTRQYIMKFCRRARRRMTDPLVEFFWLQLQRKNQKRGSLEVMRLYKEYTAQHPAGIYRPPSMEGTADSLTDVGLDEVELPTVDKKQRTQAFRWSSKSAFSTTS